MFIINTSVTLREITPKISRNLKIPSDLTLDQFHETIQAAMGWTNTHLYMFTYDGALWGIPNPDDPFETMIDSRDIKMSELLMSIGGAKTISYIYDYGDGWDHSVYFGKQSPPVSGEIYPQLTKARGQCPMEDSGGPWEYMAILEKLVDPSVEVHREDMFEFYPEDWDPEDVDLQELQERVADYAEFVRSPEYSRTDPFFGLE